MRGELLAGRRGRVTEIGLELAIIVVGVVIALSFDSLVEWRRDRVLLREARDNLAHEIRDNRADLAESLATQAKYRTKAEALLENLDRLLAAGSGEYVARMSINTADLKSTSWDTAQSTGAIRHMPYPEVKRYTELYLFQREVVRMQERMLERGLEVVDWRPIKIETLGPPERHTMRRELSRVVFHMGVVDDLGQRLLKRYDQMAPAR